MKRYIKYLIIPILFLLIFVTNDVNAEEKAICQYKTANKQESLNIWRKDKKVKIEYRTFGSSPSRDTGGAYDTGYHSYSTIFKDYANSTYGSKIDDEHICTEYAYRIKNPDSKAKVLGQYYFTCLDNGDDYCKKTYKDLKIIETYNFDPDGNTVNTSGNVSMTENGETRAKNEQEAINVLSENKIVIKDPDSGDGEGCQGLFGPVITEDINTVLKYIKYLGPILIIVLSILDFIKVVASGANDEFNKVWKRLLTRLVVAILLFFVVDLVRLLFHVFGITVPDNCLK